MRDRVLDGRSERRVTTDEPRLERLVHPERIVRDEHLAIALGARADADRRHRDGCRDLARDVGRNRLEDDRVHTRLFESERIREQPLATTGITALDLEAAELVIALRRQADVAHDGNPRRDQLPDELRVNGAALELDRVTAAILHQLPGVGHRLLERRLIRHERHVADDVSSPGSPRDRATVIGHLVERHRQGRVVTLDDHAERIADQEDVRACFFEKPRKRGVIGSEHGDLLAFLFHLPERVDGDATRSRLHSVLPFSFAVDRTRRSPVPENPATRSFGLSRWL